MNGPKLNSECHMELPSEPLNQRRPVPGRGPTRAAIKFLRSLDFARQSTRSSALNENIIKLDTGCVRRALVRLGLKWSRYANRVAGSASVEWG